MSATETRGPGGLVMYEAGLDPSRLELDGGPASWTTLPPVSLHDFADETLRGEDPQRVCIFLDAPRRTSTRCVAALAIARYLLTQGRSVVVVDGDDQRPDLSLWAGRQETEGWADVVRYGVSTRAASLPLPWGPSDGRVMGVGSYHPVRAETEEIETLCRRLLEDFDTVLICASTGDRGAYWAQVSALRVICWDRAEVDSEEMAVLIRDTASQGAAADATIAFGVSRQAAAADGDTSFTVETAEAPRRSSPFFKRLTISMAVLVIVLGSWFLGQLALNDSSPVAVPEQTLAEPEPTPTDTAAVDTLAFAGADSLDAAAADTLADVLEQTVAVVAEEPVVDVPPSDGPPALDWTLPVEEGVYCLQVYSMVNHAMAQEQLRWMDRRGVAGMIRNWRDPDGKLWYRIYAGSFGTLRAARAAMPELCEKLETDWAMPKKTGNIR